MSNEMPSWRSLASSATRSIKGYVAQRDLRRSVPASRDIRPGAAPDGSNRSTWSQWAGQKIRSIGQGDNQVVSTENLCLFPGWACRRYAPSRNATLQDPLPFDVDIFISGFASRSSGQGFGTRAGRAFLRLAKSYAALPKLAASAPDDASTSLPQGPPASSSADDLLASLHLPPKPEDMTDAAELEALNEHLQRMDMDNASVGTGSSTSSQRSVSPSGPSPSNLYPPPSEPLSNQLRRLHNNLENRLYPFWSSSLSSRSVRISIYATDPVHQESYKTPPLSENLYDDEAAPQYQPIATQETITAADGSFQVRFSLSWEKMCVHPAALHIAFGDSDKEPELFVMAELMPGPSRPTSPGATPVPYAVRVSRVHRNVFPTDTKTLVVPLTHSPVRLISDIDDTVKMSGILGGARAAFHNVFVKDLSESVIPGMGDWYMDMWRRGVRFHYVSNSPFELLPVVNEFIQLSHLPPGSVRLKSYAGRSLFNGLLSAPAERKRIGILDILDSFMDARFFLVGDSGEQDLELYASLARERPMQILGIFIRDASNYALVKPLDDPTGKQTLPSVGRNTQSSPGLASQRADSLTPTPRRLTSQSVPESLPSRPSYSGNGLPPPPPRRKLLKSYSRASTPPVIREEPDYFSSQVLVDAPLSEEPASMPLSYPPPGFSRIDSDSTSQNFGLQDGYFSSSRSSGRSASTGSSMRGVPPMTDAERKQFELQMRVYRARTEIPEHIPLRVFREPSECIETQEILDRLKMGRRQL